MAAWRNGGIVGRINEVAVRRVQLVVGWVTVFDRHTTLVSLASHPGQLSLRWTGNEYRPQGSDALRLGNKTWFIPHVNKRAGGR